MNTVELQRQYHAVRARLRNPPNAIQDRGINLKTGSASPPAQREPIGWRPPRLPRLVQAAKPAPIPEPPPPPSPTVLWQPVRFIFALVASHFGQSVADLRRRSRRTAYIFPRKVAIYLIVKHTKHSVASLGRHLGYDHSTLIHHRNHIQRMIESDAEFAREIRAIEENIAEAYCSPPAVPTLHQPVVAQLPRPNGHFPGI